MTQPLDGVRVVELGVFVAAPAVGMLLADWGADVIKIEAPEGDPWRYSVLGKAAAGLEAPVFELDNRGKRSVVVDLKDAEQRPKALALIGSANIFITNVRPPALERLGLDPTTLLEATPGLVILQVTGYGLDGPETALPGFDISAFWAKSGVGTLLGEPGQPPVVPRGASGDHATALAGAGAALAAMHLSRTTGEGDIVQVSLASVGAYIQALDSVGELQGGRVARRESRETPVNPLQNSYQVAPDEPGDEARWIMLACLQGDRHWPGLCQALDRVDLLADERFLDNRTRFKNNRALVELLDTELIKRTVTEWAPVFEQYGVIWGPFQTSTDTHSDPQFEALGTFPSYHDARVGGAVRTVDSPAQFTSSPRTISMGAPRLGQHTDEVFAELNLLD